MKSIALSVIMIATGTLAFAQESYWSPAPAAPSEKTVISNRPENDKQEAVTVAGEKLSFKHGPVDTVIAEDPITGAHQMILTRMDPIADKINGNEIYNVDEVDASSQNVKVKQAISSVAIEVKEALGMNDAKYGFTNVVINEKGQIVYFDFNVYGGSSVSQDERDAIGEKILNNLNNVMIEAVKKDGKAVPFRTSMKL